MEPTNYKYIGKTNDNKLNGYYDGNNIKLLDDNGNEWGIVPIKDIKNDMDNYLWTPYIEILAQIPDKINSL